MPGSFKKIDYRLRPAKHAERVMLLDLFKRMRFAPIETYQYIGFGSIAFIDFRMVHKTLGIKDLISIEDASEDAEQERFRHNSPYNGLELHFGHSSAVLPSIDFKRRSLVWLDYDGSLSRSIANDLATIGRHVSSGSFLGVTFTTAFPFARKKRDRELKRLKEDFSNFLADDTKATEFDGAKYAEFGRSTLGSLLEKAVSDADAGETDPGKKRRVFQSCFFKYKDGAPMVTVGWFIVAENELNDFEASKFGALPFVKTKNVPFTIRVPLVTPLEIREMERRLPNIDGAADLDWIPDDERKSFSKIYRYLPQYSVVEQV